jgi:hypothetical protein
MQSVDRSELVALVRQIQDAPADPGVDVWLERLKAAVPHPAVADLIFWPPGNVELSADEIVDRALAYKPQMLDEGKLVEVLAKFIKTAGGGLQHDDLWRLVRENLPSFEPNSLAHFARAARLEAGELLARIRNGAITPSRVDAWQPEDEHPEPSAHEIRPLDARRDEARARALLGRLVETQALEVRSKRTLEWLVIGTMTIVAGTGSTEQRASDLLAWLVDQPEVVEVYADELAITQLLVSLSLLV